MPSRWLGSGDLSAFCKLEGFLQAKQLHEDWQVLTDQQKDRESQLKKKEQELILQREDLERDRLRVLGEVKQDGF